VTSSIYGLRIERNIAFAQPPNPNQRLDLYITASASDQNRVPLVMYVHGGGWESGNRDDGWPFIEPILKRVTSQLQQSTID